MPKPSDIKVIETQVYFLPVETRIPLKFGAETLTHVTCARVRVTVEDRMGRHAQGWGETPLNVQWVWPSGLSFQERELALKTFVRKLARAWVNHDQTGHPLELGDTFDEHPLTTLVNEFNFNRDGEDMPWLAALVCLSPFDIAIHDAYAALLQTHVYNTYGSDCINQDLSCFIHPAYGSDVSFAGLYPNEFLIKNAPATLPVWHLVGGKDWISEEENDGSAPADGYPFLLRGWIERDGLKCLKIKLRGNDAEWDYGRVVQVGRIAVETSVDWLSVDFNCTVMHPGYVNEILDKLLVDDPGIYGMILYVEQPFPYELEEHRIDVHSVSARKPLFMDESAHDWTLVRMGRELGWSGVALKTCKTQTGAILSACWAKAHGMTLMVQDLTNPMLAQIPHVQLAAHVGTIMGVESNGMQFYPAASAPEAAVHPGLYQRRDGVLHLDSLGDVGFGYRLDEIQRDLPEIDCEHGR